MSKLKIASFPIGLALLGTSACPKSSPPDAARGDAAAHVRPLDLTIDMAEDRRRMKDIPPDALHSHDPVLRRRVVRALARILDEDDEPLLAALEDDDHEIMAWAAYGLGESCKGHEDVHVRALAARLSSLDQVRDRASLDPSDAIVRALGRCGSDLAERTLRARIRRDDTNARQEEAAAYALGDIAAKRGSLSMESAAVLLDAASRTPPVDAALYPFGRAEGVADEQLEQHLVAAARAALERTGPARVFAVRALGRASRVPVAQELARVLLAEDFAPAERAEAARALARLHRAGQSALAEALLAMLSRGGLAWTGDRYGVSLVAIGAVRDDLTKALQQALLATARLELPPGSPAAIARRASALRCAAAERLAGGAWDSDIVRTCDVADGESGERARAAALDRGQWTGGRRAALLRLARPPAHLRVREAAIEAIAHHPELGDVARELIAEALAANEPGIVAKAANVVRAHPDRMRVLPDRKTQPVLDPRVAAALRAAIARAWTEDLVETRAALVDAALAVDLDEGHLYGEAACRDVNITMRTRAAAALAAAGHALVCSAPRAPGDAAYEIGHQMARTTRVVFETDAGALGIAFDPSFAPIAATRFVALARSGFYTGVAVHRVAPGFVVQLGDRGGDGYAGSGRLLRCETSPLPFGALDVGVALAGRDTGSSQFFVTLARYPHLDGLYAWVGRAQGDWNAVTEGDIVERVRVEE